MRFMKEKGRKLSDAEKRRLTRFEATCAQLAEKGYSKNELTVGIVKANVITLLIAIPVCVILVFLFFFFNDADAFRSLHASSLSSLLLYLAAFLALIVIHELIHGLTWGIFAEDHFKSIEFGFMKEYLTPYCTCGVPLRKGQYILGALMPLIVLGLIPSIIAIAAGSFPLLIIGMLMIIGAGGDIIITAKILAYKKQSEDILYIDHPTEAGGVVFEKK